jgi:hypothetical protein
MAVVVNNGNGMFFDIIIGVGFGLALQDERDGVFVSALRPEI